MRFGKYRINSSVIIASVVALLASATDLLSNGAVVHTLVDIIMHFLNQPESFRPFLTDKIYQGLLTFLPIIIIILRNTNVKYRPPVEKITDE